MRFVSVVLLCAAMLVSPATAQDGRRDAYAYAVKCFYANMWGVSYFERNGDKASAATSEAKARLSWDGALKLGHSLGMSTQQVRRDLDGDVSPEPAKLSYDEDYFNRTAAACKKLGLM